MLLGMLVGVVLAANHPKKAAPAAEAGAPAAAIRSLRLGLDATLKDYPSARFRDVHLAPLGDGGWMVCGFVNSKNGAGGYSGWTRFQGLNSTEPEAIVLLGESADLANVLNERCAQQPGWGAADLSTALAPR